MIALRERVLPRWLGIFTGVTAVALAVNAGFVFASFVPALLLFLLWTLITSIVLLRRTPSTQTRIAFEGRAPTSNIVNHVNAFPTVFRRDESRAGHMPLAGSSPPPITRRSQVQILPPLLPKAPETALLAS